MGMQLSERSYVVRVNTRIAWRLHAVNDTQDWLDEFASIVGMSEDDIHPVANIIFIPKAGLVRLAGSPLRRIDAALTREYPRDNWTCRKHRALRLWKHNQLSDIICEIDSTKNRGLRLIAMWDALRVMYRSAVQFGCFPLHTCVLQRDGRGVLLAGGPGSGKSTCCRRIPPPWTALCDDEALVVPRESGGYSAHAFPTWSTHMQGVGRQRWSIQGGVPVSGIFFLEQATTDNVIPIGRGQTAIMVNQSASGYIFPRDGNETLGIRDSLLRRQLFENACRFVGEIPAYRLSARIDGTFWKEIERVLSFYQVAANGSSHAIGGTGILPVQT